MNMSDNEVLRVEEITKYYTKQTSMLQSISLFCKKLKGSATTVVQDDAVTTTVKANDGITFSVKKGQVFVIAGESGSGKSTIAKIILQVIEPDSGKIIFQGQHISKKLKNKDVVRLQCQMIQQDPYDSINPRMKIKDIILEPLQIHKFGDKLQCMNRVAEVLTEVRLEPVHQIMEKYPHALSGGQRQRVVLARALALKPKLIIADEPVSMLDVSIRAEILELMKKFQQKYSISFVYITHDLATAKLFGNKIAVLYQGKIVETGDVVQVLKNPRHPYTQALIDAVSQPDPKNRFRRKNIRIKETVQDTDVVIKTTGGHNTPNAHNGCNFEPRCPYVIQKCKVQEPKLEKDKGIHKAACFVDITQIKNNDN